MVYFFGTMGYAICDLCELSVITVKTENSREKYVGMQDDTHAVFVSIHLLLSPFYSLLFTVQNDIGDDDEEEDGRGNESNRHKVE